MNTTPLWKDSITLKMQVVRFSEKKSHLTTARCRNPQNDYHSTNKCCWNRNPCFMYLSKGNINVICIVATWWAKSHSPCRLKGCVNIKPTTFMLHWAYPPNQLTPRRWHLPISSFLVRMDPRLLWKLVVHCRIQNSPLIKNLILILHSQTLVL